MPSCCFYGCNNSDKLNTKNGTNFRFHRFIDAKVNPRLYKQWIIASKRKKFDPCAQSTKKPTVRVCSKHFSERDYDWSHVKYDEQGTAMTAPELKETAVPNFALRDGGEFTDSIASSSTCSSASCR